MDQINSSETSGIKIQTSGNYPKRNILNIEYNSRLYQKDATFLDLFVSTDALHVSGGSSAHRQEHIPVHTASSIVNQYCC